MIPFWPLSRYLAPVRCSGESRRQPFRTVLWLTTVIVAAAFAYAGSLLVRSGGTVPALGWDVVSRGPDWFVRGVQPLGPAAGRLQPDDRVIHMNGAPPVRDAGLYFQRRGLLPGDTYEIVVERHGVRHTHRIAVGSASNLAGQLAHFLVSLVWCAVGLFIGFARPERTLSRLASAAAIATGMVFLEVSVIRSGPTIQPLHVMLGCHFFVRFPHDRPSRAWASAALAAMYAIGALTALPGLLAHGTVLAFGPSIARELADRYLVLFDLRVLVGAPAYMVAVVAMVVALPFNYRRLNDEDLRRRVRWVVYGSAVGLALQVWWAVVNTFERLVGPAPVSRYTLLANTLTIAIPLTVAYAVIRHRVLDISVVVRRGVQYLLARGALQTAIIVPFVALIYIVFTNRRLTFADLVSDTGAYLYWLGGAAATLKFREPIQQWLDRRFFREAYDREQLMLTWWNAAARVDSMTELSQLLATALSAMHPTRVWLWYHPGERTAWSFSESLRDADDFPSGARLLAWLDERRGEPIAFPVPEEAGLSPWEAAWFADRQIELIVPITDGDDRLTGVLLLGAKRSEEPYTSGDRRLLSAMARQVAVVADNLRLRARVGEDVRIRHDVLARLDRRLVDLLRECPRCGACFDGPADTCPTDGRRLMLSLPVSRTIDGKYRLDQFLGRGGMGAVYEARDLRLERDVAVKILLGRAAGQTAPLRRFHREARAAARLNHPNIVAVHDFGRLEGAGAYLVMERVRGVTLRAALAREPMLPQAAAAWFAPLLDGLEAAHAAGIVHRDLKPENVMGWRECSGALRVKILDLGLAKLRVDAPHETVTVTVHGVTIGTVGYMSPEQLRGLEVDQRTDIFAVGVMLLEALTGERPVGHAPLPWRTPAEWRALTAWRDSSIPEVRALHDLVQRCVADEPRYREASAATLRGALVPLLESCPPLYPSATSRGRHSALS